MKKNHSQIELEASLKVIANNFWEKRGAKFGQLQTSADITTNGENDDSFAGRPYQFTDETQFITHSAEMEVGGYDGRRVTCALWVQPILKSGKPGEAIRYSYLSLSKF